MAVRKQNNVAYSLGQPTSAISPEPIIAKRAPTADDKAQPGTIWIDQTTDGAYILTTIQDNAARWSDVSGDGIQFIETDTSVLVPSGGRILLNGDVNISVEGAGDIGGIFLKPIIRLPETEIDIFGFVTQGMITIGQMRIAALGSRNIFIGESAGLLSNVGFKANMIAIGFGAMGSSGGSDGSIAIGGASQFNGGGQDSISIGNQAMFAPSSGGLESVAIGYSAMRSGGGEGAIAIGSYSMNNGSGNRAIAIGHRAMLESAVRSDAIAIGPFAMEESTAGGESSIAIGRRAMQTGTAISSIAIGDEAFQNGSGDDAVAIGRFAMKNGSGTGAVAIGLSAMLNSSLNIDSIAIGREAMKDGGAADCISIGRESMFLAGSAGVGAIAIGSQSMQTNAGDYSIAIGFGTMSTGCGELCIAIGALAGNDTPSTVDNCIYLANPGDAAETNGTIRIGNDLDHLRAFISGIRGVTTGVNDAIPVVIDSAGQLGTVSSSLRFKENIEDIDAESSKLYQARPVSFTYKDQTTPEKHYGFIAEEFEHLFPELVVKDDGQPTTIKYHELYALMIKEIQNLRAEIDILKSRIGEK